MIKKIVRWCGWISLVFAFVYGQFGQNEKDKVKNLELVRGFDIVKINHTNFFKVFKNDSIVAFLSFGKANGYGGPLEVAVLADTLGGIVDVELVTYNETFSYIKKLKSKNYFRQFQQKRVNSKFLINKDVEAVSGATISSNAIALAVRNASYTISTHQLDIETPKIEKKWQITYKEGIVLFIFVLGVFTLLKKSKKLRYLSLALSFIFLGFVFNASISVAHFGRLSLGYIPDLHEHLVWWILMGGSFLGIFIWGKNIYCHAVCPFQATQVLLNKLSGINLRLGPKIIRVIKNTPLFLLWLSLVMILISTNPTISSYEPFALLFSLDGVGIQWYILPTSLIGALFISNFFCRFFCPVGGALKWLLQTRRKAVELISNKNKCAIK